jgi:HK97 gp10 family phage protein
MTASENISRVEGVADTLKAFDRLGAIGKREAGKALDAGAQAVRTTAIKSIQRGSKTGEVYTEIFATIGGKVIPIGERSDGNNLSASHQSSAPGESPATDTGFLASSIKADRKDLSAKVFSSLQYAFWLEYGTTKMEARPFITPALFENEKLIIDKLVEGITKATLEFYK